ncbi:hypothetical protein ACLMJK_003591 [Lecanora helva]
MPPTRRKPANASTRNQPTLTFGPPSTKVTKPSVPSQNKKASRKSTQDELKNAPATESVTPEPEAEDVKLESEIVDVKSEPEAIESPRRLAIRKQSAAAQAEGSEAEQQAKKIPEESLRKYWQGKEDERLAPRVHQGEIGFHEKILRHFDLSSQYGPCIGIPRMKRWKRADGLGLKPPMEVLAVLLIEEKKKNNTTAERAFMDGLLTSRLAVNE